MSDAVWLVLISAGAGVLGAAVGALGTIFGPAWSEARARRADASRAEDDARYEQAFKFIEALVVFIGLGDYRSRQEAHLSRSRFVATLRPGEGAVEKFTAELLDLICDGNPQAPLKVVNEATDQLFGWLRGDFSAEKLSASWAEAMSTF